MIAGDGVMFAVAAVLAVVSWQWGTSLALLVIAALVIGTVDAFYLPSSGSMPRQLVTDANLPRALALRQSGSQFVSMIGGPVGGALVGFAGFPAASLTDSVSFGVVLVALIVIKPRFIPPGEPRRPVLRESADGIRVALTTPGLAAVLVLVAAVAGFVIPVPSLLVPLIARQHHWTAAVAGVIVGTQAAGGIVIALVVIRRGAVSRPGLAGPGDWHLRLQSVPGPDGHRPA
jgi:MFS family permease